MLKEVSKWMKNFIWTSVVHKIVLVTVS